MRLKSIIYTIAILSTFLCSGQFKNFNNTIGFICGAAGSSTPIIKKVNKKIDDKKYSKIVAMLYSKNTAENFLGVVLCEKLNEKGKIKLRKKILKRLPNITNQIKLQKFAEVVHLWDLSNYQFY